MPLVAKEGLLVRDALVSRVQWIVALRLVLITLFLLILATFFLGGRLAQYPVSIPIVFWTIGLSYAIAIVYSTLIRRGKHLMRVSEVQIVVDQIFATVIVFVSGGPTSGATSLYALGALSGAVLIGARGAILGAVAGLSLYGLLSASLVFHWVSAPRDQPTFATDPVAIAYPFFGSAIGIVVGAALGAYLAERLRRTGGELEIARERATRAERLAELGKVAAWLAHEIRNPLGSIRGSIEMLRESPGLSDEERTLCEIVQTESERLNGLVTDMLDLARPRDPQMTPVQVQDLIAEISKLAARSSEAKNVAIKLSLEATRPWALCDGAQLRQVLWNLLRNALEASPEQSEVSITTRNDADTISIEIVDAGPGIAEEDRQRIFDVFYTKQRGHGVGIGLAVVKQIIDAHRGVGAALSVDSGQGGGARFRLDFLVAEAPPQRESPTSLKRISVV